MANSERMAPVDVTWLRMDAPTNPMVIVGILMLEGPVDLDRLERLLTTRLLAIPRFRQRIEERLTGLWWFADPHFNINRHIKRVRLPGAGGRAELEHFVADLASQTLDQSRPLWQFHIVESYNGGAALITRIHHAIADGIALIGVLLSLTDTRPDAPEPQLTEPQGSASQGDRTGAFGPLAPLAELIGEGLRLSGTIWRGSLDRAANPVEAVEDGANIATELAHLIAMSSDSRTLFKGKPVGDKRVAWTDPLKLPEVKVIGRVLGCSINDMLLASVTGALHSYLKDKGARTEGVEVRALVPINLRGRHDPEMLGNRFGIIAVELPVGLENPLARLYEVRRRTQALKNSYEPPVTLGLITALGYAPRPVQDRLLDLLLSRATAVMTNVPGPQFPLYLAGARMNQVMFWVPQPGDIGMGVSILSFDGHVQFGLMTDAAVVPDPEAVIARFTPEFEQFLYFVLMEEAGKPSPADTMMPEATASEPSKGKPVHREAPTGASKGNGAMS